MPHAFSTNEFVSPFWTNFHISLILEQELLKIPIIPYYQNSYDIEHAKTEITASNVFSNHAVSNSKLEAAE